MAKKNNSESLGCLGVIVIIAVLYWMAENIVGVIGVILIIVAIYLRHYKRRINHYIFWSTFAAGVIATAIWFG